MDPEGRPLLELGPGEEYGIRVVDLDRVTTVRRQETRGMNRLPDHFERAPRAVFEPDRRLLDRPH